MTTENQIQVNLQKFKSGKQNFGAIEDAIEEQKGLAYELSSKMKDVYMQLEDEYASTLDAISGDVDNLGSSRSALFNEFDRYYQEYWEIADTLTQYSNWNNDAVIELSSNFTDMDNNINNLQNSVMQSLKF